MNKTPLSKLLQITETGSKSNIKDQLLRKRKINERLKTISRHKSYLSVDPGWKHRGNPPAYKTVCISDLPHCHDKPVKSLVLKKGQFLKIKCQLYPCYIPTAINYPNTPLVCVRILLH